MIAPCSNLDDEAETVLHSDESIEESYLQKELISKLIGLLKPYQKNPNTADTVFIFLIVP
ncbi:MAG: hypothetical protein ACLR13_10815 [Acutalibacteraceae bacterium]